MIGINTNGVSTINLVPNDDTFHIQATDTNGAIKTLKGIKDITSTNDQITITDSTGHSYVVNSIITQPVMQQIVGPKANVIGSGTILSMTDYYLRSNAHVWTREFAKKVLDGTNPSPYNRMNNSYLTQPTNARNNESRDNNLSVICKYTVPRVTGAAFLKVTYRFNHAVSTFGIMFKRGDLYAYTEESFNPGNNVNNRTVIYDISGVSGNIVAYAWAERWNTVITSVELVSNDNNFEFQKGTWSRFNQIKDSLLDTSQYYITDINNGNGVLAIKVGNVWKDVLGRNITQNYRA